MEFIDFRKLLRSRYIDLLFPGWEKGEKVAFLSPHDDDVLLGAGYLLLSTVENKGIPHVIIFSRGDAGYSTPDEKSTIVQRREKEALRSYRALGVFEQNIHFFGITDFSVMPYVNRHPPGGKGIFERLVRLFREEKISRVVFSSGHYENWDHTAVFNIGMYVVPQAGDAVLADLGRTHPVKTYLIYSVWGDFEPRVEEERGIKADYGVIAAEEHEKKILETVALFSSQGVIVEDIVAHRKRRKSEEGYLELYREAGLRKQVDYRPYLELIRKCRKKVSGY